MRERYETLKLNDLRDIAKKRGIKGASGMKKSEIIDAMCEMDEKEREAAQKDEQESKSSEKKAAPSESKPRKKKIVMTSGNANQSASSSASAGASAPAEAPKNAQPSKGAQPSKEEGESQPQEVADGDSAGGILEVMQDGYGFIRCENYLPGENDVYVAPGLIRKYNLKTGDILTGVCRAKKETDKFAALSVLLTVNGYKPEVAMGRWDFDKMTPIFPNSRIRLEQPGCSVAMRIMDLISPIGKGQRGMIVSPPKAGKTTLLKEVAKSIL
ncbi:MAG: Rho termination factor N-terminal domain-containing protein, partial [Firmicutes bacterium]|nr:Rho termination factor N-terminal domain-containing protein [Bacillota bacterium]